MNAFAKIRFFFIISLIGVVLFSCDPNEKLPPETFLEFVNYRIINDTAMNLKVRFQKGNGNLGLDDRDTNPPFVGKYRNNLFIHVLDKQPDGTYAPMRIPINNELWDTIIYSNRFPFLNTDPNSSVRGMIDIPIPGGDFEPMQKHSELGWVKFEVYLYDRDLIRSNTVISPEIQIK
ncbi:MAG: hypothetical protein LBH22_01100 [Bacteroidales bacterium]|jgi:hypothetical protein|nr:hypothetical protein [Bacteroidales bacterium]